MVLLVPWAQAEVGSDDAGGLQPAAARPGRWLGPDDRVLPFTSHEQVLEALRTAKVIKVKEIPTGTSKPKKLTLDKDGVHFHAIFRTVDNRAFNVNEQSRHQAMLKDSYLFEVAAYRLSLLLGLTTVPPAVLRTIDGQQGSLQLWIEHAQSVADLDPQALDQRHRRWIELQKLSIVVFDNLIHNFDRNTGNMLVDTSHKLWFIDHTRTFTRGSQLPSPEVIIVCDRSLFEHLKALDEKTLRSELEPYLDGGQLSALCKRRRRLIRHIEGLIKDKTADRVLFDLTRYQTP